MTDFQTKAPGVHLEEIKAVGPIAGAGTSTAALIGTTREIAEADLGKPVAVTNWTAYVSRFGEFGTEPPTPTLPHAVRGFFQNGGTTAYIVPVQDMTGLGDALTALTRTLDVSMVCLPGITDAVLQKTVIDHCQEMGDRIAVLDGARDEAAPQNMEPVRTQREGLVTDRGFGALYWPWIRISDPGAPADEPALMSVPPSGHIAGVMARSDNERGVHKAPANEPVRGAVDLEVPLNDGEQAQLNNLGINALRVFPGSPPMVWGARALSNNTAWRFVNVRRLMAYISDSLLQGLRWATFEPNNTTLWKKLERTVTEFLTRVWQSGALFGETAAEAFYVKIDEELNPAPVRDLGQVFIEIGVAPTRPAEHVVIQLGLWSGGVRVNEG
ncbi:phage tail sheath family protein [Streptomyces sp. NPDC053367]|uniref:phage tail sheath family protein n=1 Tax=Streptomyces sp. NPDC053367 TaxID=3365700 RepID=UPI0037D30302